MDQRIVLPRPNPALHVGRNGEEEPQRVHLRPVRAQRIVADFEKVPAVNLGGGGVRGRRRGVPLGVGLQPGGQALGVR
jgi:hypothetical protein